ncbi:hypothetical protein FOZ63_005448, partial [Perkinsus olseni]
MQPGTMIARGCFRSGSHTGSMNSVLIPLPLSMNTIGVLLVIVATATSQPDWSSVDLEPPVEPAPTESSVDFSGIVLEPLPGQAPTGGQLDLSGITLDPPVTPASSGSQIDWSSVSLEAPATTGTGLDWSSITLEDPWVATTDQPTHQKAAGTEEHAACNDRSTVTGGCPTALLGVLLAASLASLLANIVQAWLLKKLLSRSSMVIQESVDLELGN